MSSAAKWNEQRSEMSSAARRCAKVSTQIRLQDTKFCWYSCTFAQRRTRIPTKNSCSSSIRTRFTEHGQSCPTWLHLHLWRDYNVSGRLHHIEGLFAIETDKVEVKRGSSQMIIFFCWSKLPEKHKLNNKLSKQIDKCFYISGQRFCLLKNSMHFFLHFSYRSRSHAYEDEPVMTSHRRPFLTFLCPVGRNVLVKAGPTTKGGEIGDAGRK